MVLTEKILNIAYILYMVNTYVDYYSSLFHYDKLRIWLWSNYEATGHIKNVRVRIISMSSNLRSESLGM